MKTIDYDVVIGKVPSKDKKGNDITADKLGSGGYHRSDGTYFGVAYVMGTVLLKLAHYLPEERCG